MSIPYEELCRGCFDTHESFEERIESCTGVIAAKRNSKDVERAFFSRGLNREAIGDFVGALEDYSRVIALTPMPSYFECRANMYSATGNDEAALRDYARVLELDPQEYMAHCYIGHIHGARGDYALAIQCYTRALELNPTLPVAYFSRYQARASLGDRENACRDLDKAIEFGPTI
jgi:tetratricopeptide (TPR) repeat protein